MGLLLTFFIQYWLRRPAVAGSLQFHFSLPTLPTGRQAAGRHHWLRRTSYAELTTFGSQARFHFNPKSKILIIWHLNYLLRRTDVNQIIMYSKATFFYKTAPLE